MKQTAWFGLLVMVLVAMYSSTFWVDPFLIFTSAFLATVNLVGVIVLLSIRLYHWDEQVGMKFVFVGTMALTMFNILYYIILTMIPGIQSEFLIKLNMHLRFCWYYYTAIAMILIGCWGMILQHYQTYGWDDFFE